MQRKASAGARPSAARGRHEAEAIRGDDAAEGARWTHQHPHPARHPEEGGTETVGWAQW